MAARRPVRQQTFRVSDIISNDNNDSNNDSAIGEIEMEDSAPFRTGIQGLRVNFHAERKSDQKDVKHSLEIRETQKMLKAIDEKFIISGETKPRQIQTSDWITPRRAWKVLKSFSVERSKENSEVGNELESNQSELAAFLKQKLKRSDEILTDFSIKEREPEQEKVRAEVNSFVLAESSKVENLMEVKAIDDRLRADRKLIALKTQKNKFTGLSEQETLQMISDQEPPFLARMSESEKAIIWNWVLAKEEALEKLHSSKSYQFASQVAGFSNMELKDLITSAFGAKGTYEQLKGMPVDAYTDPQIASERESLAQFLRVLGEAFLASRKKDVGDAQERINAVAVAEEPRSTTEQGRLKRLSTRVFGQTDERRQPQFFSGQVATFENTEFSTESLQIQSLEKTLKKMLEGNFVDESKRRMFLASNWMQRPEVLRQGQLDHRFYSAIQGAFMRAKALGCQFTELENANAFIESDDPVVVTSFAELTALQIMRADFINPKRVRLDKTGDRILAREQRLKLFISRFSIGDDNKVTSSMFSSSRKTKNEFFNF